MLEIKTFREANQLLKDFVPPASQMHKNYTLDRMRILMDKLGNPQNRYKVIHVAGTSGKTSTCYFMAALLKEAGQKVGLTVSPHIDEINERVQINLKPLSENYFCSELSQFLEELKKTGVTPTYFELLVAFAYWEFARQNVDYAVIEVGLGGLLDATNIITPPDKICVITDIGLDHTSVLGNTVEKIAAQKAGIVQPRNHVFTHRHSPSVMGVLQARTLQQQAQLHIVLAPEAGLVPDKLPLFHQRNWYLAYNVYQYVGKRDELSELSEGQLELSAKTYIPARLEIVSRAGKTIIMDGAHNAQKMHALVTSLTTLFPDQKIACLFGLIKSKDYRIGSTLKELAKIANHLIITTFETEQDLKRKSVDPHTLASFADNFGVTSEIIENPKHAYEKLLQRSELVLAITGSFFLIQTLRPYIFKEHHYD